MTPLKIEPQHRVHIQSTDIIPAYLNEFRLSSKIAKQGDNEEECDDHSQPQQPKLCPEAQAELYEVMNMLSMKLHETAADFERRRTLIRNEYLASISEEQVQLHVRFIPKLPSCQLVLHQVNPSRECHVT